MINTSIITTTTKTTEKQRKIVKPRLAVDLNALIQYKDYFFIFYFILISIFILLTRRKATEALYIG